MSIYKRGDTWWIQFTSPSGERVQRSARTSVKKEAQELHDKLKAEMWRVKTLKEKPNYLWQDAAARWLIEQSDKRSLETDKDHLSMANRIEPVSAIKIEPLFPVTMNCLVSLSVDNCPLRA